MPAAGDGDWNSNWCSNVVCVRTKSSKEDAPDNGPVYVQPIVVRSVYREERPPPVLHLLPPPPPPLPPTGMVHPRRRITRLIHTPPLTTYYSPIHYEGVNRISLNLKSPVILSEFSRPPYVPRSRSPVRISPIIHQFEPKVDHNYYLPDYSSFTTSGRDDFSPTIILPPRRRAASLPPSLSSVYVRGASGHAPIYSATSGYGGRTHGDTWNVPSSLRRGSVDVSYLSSGYEPYKGLRLRSSMPAIRSDAGLRNTYRRGSLSVLGSRPTYRSSTVSRLTEEELKPGPRLSSAPESLSSLRTRTENAREKLGTHRTLIDRYLGSSRAASVEGRFVNRSSVDLDSASRRESLSSLPRPSVTGSRGPSTERHNLSSTVMRAPPSPNMSSARRRIRDVLYKVSGDNEFI